MGWDVRMYLGSDIVRHRQPTRIRQISHGSESENSNCATGNILVAWSAGKVHQPGRRIHRKRSVAVAKGNVVGGGQIVIYGGKC